MGCGCLLGVFTMLVRGSILMALSIHNRGSVWYGVLLRVSVGSCVLQRGGCALIRTIVEMSNELEVSHSAGVSDGTFTRVFTCVLGSLFGIFISPLSVHSWVPRPACAGNILEFFSVMVAFLF